jgi:hypothetical protein
MWRCLIVAVLIAWSPAAFARSNFGVKVQQVIDIIKIAGKTTLTFSECMPNKYSGGQNCAYRGEITDDWISIWVFQASESGYLEGVSFHQRRKDGMMPRFDDPSMARARELVVAMITVASISPSLEFDKKLTQLLAEYITSALIGEPLPRLPNNIHVDTKIQPDRFTVTIQRPLD